MNCNLYQVSTEGKVTCFCMNQKAPNKVGQMLSKKIKELFIESKTFDEVREIISEMHSGFYNHQGWKIASVELSIKENADSSLQTSKSLNLSCRYGTFCIFTEYQPLNEEIKPYDT